MGFASILQHPWLISLATLVIAFLVAARLLGAFRTERDEAKAGNNPSASVRDQWFRTNLDA